VKVKVSRTDNTDRLHRISYKIDGVEVKQCHDDAHELLVEPGPHIFSCSINYIDEDSALSGGIHSVTARTSVTLLGRSREHKIAIVGGGVYEWSVFVADSNLKRFAESPGIILGRLLAQKIGIKTFDPDNYESWPVALSFSVLRQGSDG
jgi:hypothetical protein